MTWTTINEQRRGRLRKPALRLNWREWATCGTKPPLSDQTAMSGFFAETGSSSGLPSLARAVRARDTNLGYQQGGSSQREAF